MSVQKRDERFRIEGDPEDALRDLMATPPSVINAEQMAEAHNVDGLALRNLLRAHPTLFDDHGYREHYRITPEIEAKITALPEFQGLPPR